MDEYVNKQTFFLEFLAKNYQNYDNRNLIYKISF